MAAKTMQEVALSKKLTGQHQARNFADLYEIVEIDLSQGATARTNTSNNIFTMSYFALKVIAWSHDDFVLKVQPNFKRNKGKPVPLSPTGGISLDFSLDGARFEFPAQPGKTVTVLFSKFGNGIDVGVQNFVSGIVTSKTGISSQDVKTGSYTIPSGYEALIKPISPVLTVDSVNVTGAWRKLVKSNNDEDAAANYIWRTDIESRGFLDFTAAVVSLSGTQYVDIVEVNSKLSDYGSSFDFGNQLSRLSTTSQGSFLGENIPVRGDEIQVYHNGSLGSAVHFAVDLLFKPENMPKEFRAAAGQVVDGESYLVELY